MHCYVTLSKVWNSNYSKQCSIGLYKGIFVFTVLFNNSINMHDIIFAALGFSILEYYNY